MSVFPISTPPAAQTAPLPTSCASTTFLRARARAESLPGWTRSATRTALLPSGFGSLSHPGYPCRVCDTERNADEVYWSKCARLGPPAAPGDSQPSNPANGKSCILRTLSFTTTPTTSDVDVSQGGCYIRRVHCTKIIILN